VKVNDRSSRARYAQNLQANDPVPGIAGFIDGRPRTPTWEGSRLSEDVVAGEARLESGPGPEK